MCCVSHLYFPRRIFVRSTDLVPLPLFFLPNDIKERLLVTAPAMSATVLGMPPPSPHQSPWSLFQPPPSRQVAQGIQLLVHPNPPDLYNCQPAVSNCVCIRPRPKMSKDDHLETFPPRVMHSQATAWESGVGDMVFTGWLRQRPCTCCLALLYPR